MYICIDISAFIDIYSRKSTYDSQVFFKHLPSRRSVAKLPKCSRDVGRNVRTKKLSSCDNNRMPDGLTSALMGGDCGRSVRFLSEFCKNKNKTDSEFQVVFGEVCFCSVVRNTFIGE